MCAAHDPISDHADIFYPFGFCQTDSALLEVPCEIDEGGAVTEWDILGCLPRDFQFLRDVVDVTYVVTKELA